MARPERIVQKLGGTSVGSPERIAAVAERVDEPSLVFLPSWNEWAEGNHLEPDTKWGLEYLQALKRVIG